MKKLVENKKELEQEKTVVHDEFKIVYFVIAAMVFLAVILFANTNTEPTESEERKKDRLETQRIFDDVKQQKEIVRQKEEKERNVTSSSSFESEERKKDRLETQKIFDDVKRQKEIHRMYEQQKESEREASDRIYKRTHKENTGSNQYEQECLARGGSDSDVCKSLGILYDKGYR